MIGNFVKASVLVTLFLLPPLCTLIYIKWDAMKPYFVGEAESAEGKLYYFMGVG